MLFRKINAFYYENHTKSITYAYRVGKMQSFLMLHRVTCVLIIVFQRVKSLFSVETRNRGDKCVYYTA